MSSSISLRPAYKRGCNIKRKDEYLVSSIILDYIFMFKLTEECNFLKNTKLKVGAGDKQ
jgi:hypothetical protein